MPPVQAPGGGKAPPKGGRIHVPSYVPKEYRSWIVAAARGTGLPASVVAAQINDESGFQPGVTSPAGAEGFAQFLPGTYADYGGKGSEYVASNELDPYIRFMSELLKWSGGDVQKALAGYNAGQGNWQAGLGYANTILANANESQALVTARGTGKGPSGGGGGSGGGQSGSSAPSWLSELWSSLGVGAKADPGSPLLPGSGFLGQTNPISATESGLLAIAAPLIKMGELIDFLLQPGHWIRIFCGLGGGVLAGAGIWNLSHVGGQASSITVQGTSIPTSAGGTLALPIGILELGLGGVLLFVAFHNLPSSVETFPDFLSYLQEEIQSAPSKAPAA